MISFVKSPISRLANPAKAVAVVVDLPVNAVERDGEPYRYRTFYETANVDGYHRSLLRASTLFF